MKEGKCVRCGVKETKGGEDRGGNCSMNFWKWVESLSGSHWDGWMEHRLGREAGGLW